MIAFTIPGPPIGKGRARVGKVGNHARLFTPAKTVSYEGLVATVAQKAMGKTPLLEGALSVRMWIDCPIPASWSQKKQRMALAGEIYPTTKPDKDNIIKAIYDGCNGIVWHDDVQIVDGWQRKRYASKPGVRVEVETANEADRQLPRLRFAGWFSELPSGMSYRLWEQGGHDPDKGEVALYEF